MKPLLPSDPVRRGAVLAALLGLSGVYFVHAYLYRPRLETADALRLRIDQLETLQQQLDTDVPPGLHDPERRVEQYSAHLARLETLIPESEEVAALLEAISVEERRTEVEVTMLRPEPRESGEVYDRWSYEVAAKGGYHQIAAFITAIASLDRIMVPSDMNISAERTPHANRFGTSAPLAASFRIRTYIAPGLPAPEATVPLAPNASIQP